MHYGDDSEDQVKKNEPCNYTRSFDCVYRSYVRNYTQGINRLHGGRRMNEVKCINCSYVIGKSPHNFSMKVIYCHNCGTEKEVGRL